MRQAVCSGCLTGKRGTQIVCRDTAVHSSLFHPYLWCLELPLLVLLHLDYQLRQTGKKQDEKLTVAVNVLYRRGR